MDGNEFTSIISLYILFFFSDVSVHAVKYCFILTAVTQKHFSSCFRGILLLLFFPVYSVVYAFHSVNSVILCVNVLIRFCLHKRLHTALLQVWRMRLVFVLFLTWRWILHYDVCKQSVAIRVSSIPLTASLELYVDVEWRRRKHLAPEGGEAFGRVRPQVWPRPRVEKGKEKCMRIWKSLEMAADRSWSTSVKPTVSVWLM